MERTKCEGIGRDLLETQDLMGVDPGGGKDIPWIVEVGG